VDFSCIIVIECVFSGRQREYDTICRQRCVPEAIVIQLDGQALLVSELATPFDISLQGVSRHIQVLVRARLVQQERSGRISRCSLDVGPLLDAAVWLNRYTKYWQELFDVLAATLAQIDERRTAEAFHPKKRGRPARRSPLAQLPTVSGSRHTRSKGSRQA
jgi:DNA-binding transcriptional ArsR family regulator